MGRLVYPLALVILITSRVVTHAQRSLYQPCPLLGPFFPAPLIDPASPELNKVAQSLNKLLDDYIVEGHGSFGPITANTTSFSLALFAGSNYVPGSDDLHFFYEYHHAANDLENRPLNKDSVFALGDLTQLFTVYTQLAALGDEVWSHGILDYVPELHNSSVTASDAISKVQWKDVTLGALAGQMSGIARSSNACMIDKACNRDVFLSALINKLPVNLPDTTPVRSDAAFQLLALAFESATKKSFEVAFNDNIAAPIGLQNTRFLGLNSQLFGSDITNASLAGEQAALGLTSTISDLAKLGRSILTSAILPPATTRRWLKPFASTSNLRNAVGRPWEIYHYSATPTDAIINLYTRAGTVGKYSSYFGIVPSYDVGFAILATDSAREAPDLNAYADITLDALLQIDKLARTQANSTIAGSYIADNNSSLVIDLATADPGLAIVQLQVNGTDWLAQIAQRAAIDPASDMDFRLYPTDLQTGSKRAYRAVVQDRDALVDAGTPTCISWQQTVDVFQKGGLPLDEFVLEMGDGGENVTVDAPALGVVFKRS